MRSFAALVSMILAFAAFPLAAQEIGHAFVEVEIRNFDSGSERFVSAQPSRPQLAPVPEGVAAYGPFRVLDGNRAAIVGVTDARTPAAFAQMMRDWPQIALLEMVDVPGTEDDRANLRLGRMIRAARIATYVPAGGSVRSGGVELFVAGIQRYADADAEFAVHAWMDEDGLEATDYAASAHENAKYLAYYRQMGMAAGEAAAFYAMTNSVPHDDARWLSGAQMAHWVKLNGTES